METSAAVQEPEETPTGQNRTERQLDSSSWAITLPAFSGLRPAMQESAYRESDFQMHQAYHAAIRSGTLVTITTSRHSEVASSSATAAPPTCPVPPRIITAKFCFTKNNLCLSKDATAPSSAAMHSPSWAVQIGRERGACGGLSSSYEASSSLME